MNPLLRRLAVPFILLLSAGSALAADGPAVAGVPIEFILFALTLLGVALFHNQTFYVALTGVTVVALYKIAVTGFKTGVGVGGFIGHLGHEWVTLANLFCLLMGFAILARHFEKSHVPVILPKFLPDDWRGAFLLLAMVWVISSFLDNIAAALIGGAMAHQLFKAKVHIGYLAAIVAASNAGGAFSVVGDTTTTMMWIAGVSPASVFEAIIASTVALAISGYVAAKQQHAYSPILKNAHEHTRVDWGRIFIVALILVFAMATNIFVNMKMPETADRFPFIGVAVWAAILVTIPVRRHDWEVLGESLKGTFFLLFLVTTASMMPVEKLPAASWQTAFGLGFVSAVFDNIPLTALAIKQDGYDWGFLAFGVGYGGSMLWFGSSAGVALSNMYPEAKSVGQWLRHGWHVALAYVVGFMCLVFITGWHPEPLNKGLNATPAAVAPAPTSSVH
ncbi:citrate transporter [Sulfurisoma sediminicola]|uniref:Sodium/proton antiporter (NhaD family) n=1 Tax=Sulfurisoma sediminicola TaxID=1381557 RepID=A0A497XBS7_9PROT|nr:citrate transporter [Sulfurisoma sediminicola]RLJ63790.1 sodium/proton antiporter (NhaD family) [Sulfurisoma sediminicola]